MSIGNFAKNLILTTELSNQQILDAVKVQFPTANTSPACIAWYKSKLRKDGLLSKRGEPVFKKPTEPVVQLSRVEQIKMLMAQIEDLREEEFAG
jgi:hypothetical protein